MRGKHTTTAVLVGLALAGTSASPAAADTEPPDLTQLSMTSGGVTRNYRVHVPSGYAGAASGTVPLVVVLHGGRGDSALASGTTCEGTPATCHPSTRWRVLADANTFLAVYPDGLPDSDGDGEQHWNDCRAFDAGAETHADWQFISDLIGKIQTDFPKTQATKIYVVGTSNGGMMSDRVADMLSNKVAAIGTVVANRPSAYDGTTDGGEQACDDNKPLNPITVAQLNGDQDPRMPWLGGAAGEGGNVLSAAATRDFWTTLNATTTTETPSTWSDLSTTDGASFSPYTPGINSTVTRTGHTGGNELAAVHFYQAMNGGHLTPVTDALYHDDTTLLVGAQNRDMMAVDELWARLSPVTLGTRRYAHQDVVQAGSSVAPGAARIYDSAITSNSVTSAHPNAVWRIAGSGTGGAGGNTDDRGHFVFETLTGDGMVTAKLNGLISSATGTTAGVMIRQSTASNAKMALLAFEKTALGGTGKRASRSTAGGSSVEANCSFGSSNVHLRVERTGGIIKFWYSTNGVSWTQCGANLSLSFTNPVDIGLFVNSGSNTSTKAAEFSSVSRTGGF